MAWPIVLANAAAPLLGLTDTAVLGHTGGTAELGAIAVGGLIFNFVYWSFGFLRMSTTGFTAQARGAGDTSEVRATLARSLLLAVAIGALLIALSPLIGRAAFALLAASPRVEASAADYFFVRIWGAPATLGMYALTGSFIGLGTTQRLLLTQLLLNGLNLALDVWFAGYLNWGARGIAWGTVISEWVALGFGLWLARGVLGRDSHETASFWDLGRILDRKKLKQTLNANADIMLRTLTLLSSFAWFTNQSAVFGDTILAANHVLLQFISFSAFFLDGYAFVAESLVGAAVGAKQRPRFDQVVRRSSELSLGTAAVLAAAIAFGGGAMLHALTSVDAVQQEATRYLPLAGAYVLIGGATFQLDGIFIGATRTRAMRNAAFEALLVFLGASIVLTNRFANTGLWLAFCIFVAARAATLALRLPALRQSIAP
ncbi:MAG TPA: MATE family efflux transporter [Croceibacterium sp.]